MPVERPRNPSGDAPDSPPTVGGTIARNSVAGFVFFGTQLLAGLVALPIALNALGRERFGLVSLVTGLAMFLQFVNLGLSMGLARFVGAYAANQNRGELQSFIGDAYFVALVGNAVVTVGMITLGLFGAPLLSVSPHDQDAFTAVALIVGITSLPNGLFAVPRGILAGLQLTALRTRRDLVGALGPLLAALLVSAGPSSVVVYTAVVQGAALIGGLLVLDATRRVMPWLRHAPHRGRDTFRRFVSFSGLQVLNQVADIVFLTSDRIVVQTLIGTAAVADYTVVERLQKLSDAVVSIPINAVLPASAEAWATGDRAVIEKLVRDGTRLYLAAILPALTVVIGLMPEFLDAWVGPGYTHLAIAAQLFVLSLAGPAFVRIFAAVLAGKGRSRENVIAKLFFAPLNLAASIVLADRFGVVGVVIPTTAYYVCVFPLVQFALMRDEGFSVATFLRDVAPVMAATLPTLAVLLASPRNLTSGLAGFGLVAAVALLASYGSVALALRPHERRAVSTLMGRARPSAAPA